MGRNRKGESDRAIRMAEYMIENQATIRQVANQFGISKSTVYEDFTVELPKQCGYLSEMVQKVIKQNKSERHIRGGNATRQKYRG